MNLSACEEVFEAEVQAIALPQAQLAPPEAAVVDLHQQMLTSPGLIQSMAELNAQLVQQIEALRSRARWLTGATSVAGGRALRSVGGERGCY